jgi:hypothetical protein
MLLFSNKTTYENGLYYIKKRESEIIYLAICKDNHFFIRKFKGSTPYNENIDNQIEKIAKVDEALD